MDTDMLVVIVLPMFIYFAGKNDLKDFSHWLSAVIFIEFILVVSFRYTLNVA